MTDVGFQAAFDAPFTRTFAYLVGPRENTYGGPDQPPYVALNIGGHAGVRVSLTPEDARSLGELLRQVLDGDMPTETGVNGPIIQIADVQVPA